MKESKWTSRKLIVFMVLETLWTILLVVGKLPAEVYGSLSTMAFLAYAGGNVGEHWAKRGQE